MDIEKYCVKIPAVADGCMDGISCCNGFDAFVDELLKVVKYKSNTDEFEYFNTISEFAEHIGKASGKSADMEVVQKDLRFVGNAPIMANAITCFGIRTTCIGPMGIESAHRVFSGMSPKCRPISIGEPAHTYAYEFADSKLMFGNSINVRKIDWNLIKSAIGIGQIQELVSESSLIALVNWSYLTGMDTILDGLLKEGIPYIKAEDMLGKSIFFDISDPSARNPKDLAGFLEKISELSRYMEVILGLNEREAGIVYRSLRPLDGNAECSDTIHTGEYIFRRTGVDILLIHTIDAALAFSGDKVYRTGGYYVERPMISTGGGDNFNAAFCTGHLLGFNPDESLVLARAAAYFYVSFGYSPDFNELLGYIEKHAGGIIQWKLL